MPHDKRISCCRLILRISVFSVMFMWTLDKFVNPRHAAGVYQAFYRLHDVGGHPDVSYRHRRAGCHLRLPHRLREKWTYGAMLAQHAVSTLSSYRQYLAPFDPGHLLFFTAGPMLAASFTLYYLRDRNTRWSVGNGSRWRPFVRFVRRQRLKNCNPYLWIFHGG